MRWMAKLAACAAMAALSASALAQARGSCVVVQQAGPDTKDHLTLVRAYDGRPLGPGEVACTANNVRDTLVQHSGKVIGYKAGLTNPQVQKRFNYDRPVWGVLYEGMLLPSGARVNAHFGTQPRFEADLLVRVKSDAVNHASTASEVMESIDQIIPFIELPDVMVSNPTTLGGSGLKAINVGARLGVVGPPIAVPGNREARQALVQQLAEAGIVLTDGKGRVLARGKGEEVMGNPLNSVVWLVGELRAAGIALKPGDVVSVGSFSPLLVPQKGQRVTATYEGLPDAQPVTVQFE